MSRTSPQLVDTLTPLQALASLRVLRFEGVVARDRRLDALGRLANLKEVCLPNFYPAEQVTRLAAEHPGLQGWGITATQPAPVRCRRCRERRCIQLIGRPRTKFACLDCESDLIIEHGLKFERLKQGPGD